MAQLVFKTSSGRIKPSVAGSIPALSAIPLEREINTVSIKKNKDKLRELPGVDLFLTREKIIEAVSLFGREPVTYAVRETLTQARNTILNGQNAPSTEQLVASVCRLVQNIFTPSLKSVVNATGVVIHTNLGRAPLGQKVLEEIKYIILEYSNLEFDLKHAARGKRNQHVVPLLKFITGAEDAVVVNNNAAGLILALHTLAHNREVIISRGELIEIGGSFRIPDILAASGAKMVEVGTTNKTHLSDYENAVNENTALILKVHKSNYTIEGFAEEVPLKDLVKLAHSKDLPVLYDIGSGLLRKPEGLPLEDEPDVKTAAAEGADLVAFSGDKLLGGPQAGIVVGKKEYIARLNRAPLMRALRVGKLTLAALSTVIRCYLNRRDLVESLPLFSILEQPEDELKRKADVLQRKLTDAGVDADVVKSTGRCGGGTLPKLKINSYAVVLNGGHRSPKARSSFAETVFHRLLDLDYPIIGILRRGDVLFDVLTLSETDFPYITSAISEALSENGKTNKNEPTEHTEGAPRRGFCGRY